jgi:hypothetical protein
MCFEAKIGDKKIIRAILFFQLRVFFCQISLGFLGFWPFGGKIHLFDRILQSRGEVDFQLRF